MVFKQCCCDPFKLTYISGIVTGIEAVAFGTLNIVLILMNKCVIEPPNSEDSFGSMFQAWYFYDDEACDDKAGYTPPNWIQNVSYPLADPRPHQTTVEANLAYQITYLVLHAAWLLSALVLIYGNARKLWGFYIPWLLITLTLLIMDVVISAFYISDMVAEYRGAMFLIMAMYFRIFIIWFLNLNKFASACNAFCKSYHKRTKQNRQRKKQQKRHEMEMAAAVENVRAEYNQPPPPQQPPPQQPPPQQPPPQPFQEPMQQLAVVAPDNENLAPLPPKKQPPPVPKKPRAPPEARPFNYLNPSFRPANSHDIEGMRANPAFVPDNPNEILHSSRPTSMNADETDYFPHDGYIRPWASRPNMLKRHDSMRNIQTQPPAMPLRRFSSTRSPPRMPYEHQRPEPYAPPPDYDLTLGRPHPSTPQQKPMPRVNLGRSPSGREGQGGSYHPYPPYPASPTRPQHPPPPEPQNVIYF